MRVNRSISQRFASLEGQAEVVAKSTYVFSVDGGGNEYTKVSFGLFRGWLAGTLNLTKKVFGEDSIYYESLLKYHNGFDDWTESFETCRAIFESAKLDYDAGLLFDIRGLIKAEFFEDTLEQATELLDADFKDAACIIAGITLENALKELCDRHEIPQGKMDKMNADLCKAGFYNTGMQKQITTWADRRNRAAHGEWDKYNKSDVHDMIKGVSRFISEYV